MGLFYNSTKIFHFKEKLDSLPRSVDEILAPIHIRIKPTNVCNHRCVYCAYRSDNLQLGQDMRVRDAIGRDKMMEILDDLIEMDVKAVTFSGGGEPFCYPHLLEAVEKLSNSSIRFATLTNGSKLEGPVAEVFAQHATWLRVSIDGWDDKSYSAYRSVPSGEFTKVITNMKRFKELGGKCRLGVNFVVDRKNAEHVYDFIKRICDIGADSIKISPCIISNDSAENNAYIGALLGGVTAQIARAASELSGNAFEIFNSYHTLDKDLTETYSWCPYLQILPVIGADGNVYSCQDKAYNTACGLLGSIADQRFSDFWFDNKEKFFVIDPSEHCKHHCVAGTKNRLIFEYLNADAGHLGFG